MWLITDNRPVHVRALSHNSKDSLQNVYQDMKSIMHCRCSSHLLDLSYKNWLKAKGNGKI